MKNNYLNLPKQNALLGFDLHLKNLISLYDLKKFPKVLMLSGQKGLGKYTCINHFLNYVFDKAKYDFKNKIIDDKSEFNNQLKNNIFENIIYLNNDSTDKVKIDDVRNLKKKILKSTINAGPRFIIINDAELLNINSANGLLRLIEEPSDNNYFILIDNKTNQMIDTISSRCLKINIYFSNYERINIINNLISKFEVEPLIDFKTIYITPGLFLTYNSICLDNEITTDMNIMLKLNIFFTLYKKTKIKSYIEMSKFFIEHYFFNLLTKDKKSIFIISHLKIEVLKTINDFVLYNLNLNSVLNSINTQISNER